MKNKKPKVYFDGVNWYTVLLIPAVFESNFGSSYHV